MGLNFGEGASVVDSGLGLSPTTGPSMMALSASPESPTGSSPSMNDGDFDGDHVSGSSLRRNLSEDQVASIIASDGRRLSRGRRHSDDEDESRKARRLLTNKRERYRQQLVNDAFSSLRQLIPTFPPDKKLSKHDVLKQASRYIVFVQTRLGEAIEHQQRQQNPDSSSARTIAGSIREKQDWQFASMWTHIPVLEGQPGGHAVGPLTPSRSAEALPHQSSTEGFGRTSVSGTPVDGYYTGNPAGGFPAVGVLDAHRSTVPHPQPARHLSSGSPPYTEAYSAPSANHRTQGAISSGAMHDAEGMNHVKPQAVPHSTMHRHSMDDRAISPHQQQQQQQQQHQPPLSAGANGNFAGWTHPSPGEDVGTSRKVDYGPYGGGGGSGQPPVYTCTVPNDKPRQYAVTSQPTMHYGDERYRFEVPRSETYHVSTIQPGDSHATNHRSQVSASQHAGMY